GIMLWELCMGRRFLQGDANAHMAAVARNAKNPPKIAELLGAPEGLDEVIAKLTAFDREDRYSPGPARARGPGKLFAGAAGLPSGDRAIRARAAALLQTLFPGEPAKSRNEFARLVAEARELRAALPTADKPLPPPLPEPTGAPSAEESGLLSGT